MESLILLAVSHSATSKIFGWVFAGVIVGLIVLGFVANEFGKIAEMKGHDKTRYMVICFLLPIIGYMMVIALPDRIAETENNKNQDADYLDSDQTQ